MSVKSTLMDKHLPMGHPKNLPFVPSVCTPKKMVNVAQHNFKYVNKFLMGTNGGSIGICYLQPISSTSYCFFPSRERRPGCLWCRQDTPGREGGGNPGNDLTVLPHRKSWFIGGKSSPFMAARFRLVKYYNLPRYIYIYVFSPHQNIG